MTAVRLPRYVLPSLLPFPLLPAINGQADRPPRFTAVPLVSKTVLTKVPRVKSGDVV